MSLVPGAHSQARCPPQAINEQWQCLVCEQKGGYWVPSERALCSGITRRISATNCLLLGLLAMQIFCVELPFHNIRGTKIYQEDYIQKSLMWETFECNTSMFNMKQSLQHSLQPVSSQQLLDWVLSCLSLGLERNSTAVLKARSKQGRPATHGSVACFKYRWGVEVG